MGEVVVIKKHGPCSLLFPSGETQVRAGVLVEEHAVYSGSSPHCFATKKA